MPFRIRVTLSILLSLAIIILVGPLLVPVRPLPDTVTEASLAGPDSSFTQVGEVEVHYVDTDLGSADAPGLQQPVILLHGYLFNTRTCPASALPNARKRAAGPARTPTRRTRRPR